MLTTHRHPRRQPRYRPRTALHPPGKQLAELRVLVNARRQNDAGEWEDTEPTRHRVTCFGTLAENVTESLRTGDRVIVVGRISTDTWTDKDTGDKRTAPRVLADAVGASLRWATARPTRNRQAPQDDPTG